MRANEQFKNRKTSLDSCNHFIHFFSNNNVCVRHLCITDKMPETDSFKRRKDPFGFRGSETLFYKHNTHCILWAHGKAGHLGERMCGGTQLLSPQQLRSREQQGQISNITFWAYPSDFPKDTACQPHHRLVTKLRI